MSVAVRVGIFGLDVDVGLREGDILVFTTSKIIRRIAVTGIDHAGESEEGRVQTQIMVIAEVGEGFLKVLLNKIGFVGTAILTMNAAVGETHDDEIDKAQEKTVDEKHKKSVGISAGQAYYSNNCEYDSKNCPLPDDSLSVGFAGILD